MAATVITIAVEKGGCGKTVTTSNLAYLMGDEGKKVLCLDTDPQGNLTFALTGGNAITSKAFANRSLYDMIDGFRYNTQTRDFIVESEYENVDLIPANDQTPRLSKRLEDLYTDAQRDYDRGDPKYLALIVSQVELVKGEGGAASAVEGLGVAAAHATGEKCERCWKYSATIGSHAAHPTLCARCASVVEA